MVTIVYEEQRVLVTKEVAEFLIQDKKREDAQKRSDSRHRAYHVDPDKAVITHREKGVNLVLNEVIRNIETTELRRAVYSLPTEERLLIKYRYCDGMTMEGIGNIFGISKMAVSKRHKKLLGKLRDMLSASFLFTWLLLYCLWQYCHTVYTRYFIGSGEFTHADLLHLFRISKRCTKRFFSVWFTNCFRVSLYIERIFYEERRCVPSRL